MASLTSKVFVPNGKGFSEVTGLVDGASIDEIAQHLGYHTDQFYYFVPVRKLDPNFAVRELYLEIFTKNIAFVKTDKSERELRNHKVDFFLQGFDLQRDALGLHIEQILKSGVKNGSLTSEFLGRVLGIESPNPEGVHFSDKIGYYLFFNQGKLNGFRAADGLNMWAKDWKATQPELLKKYEKEALFYWGEESKTHINEEINRQADAWADTFDNSRNPFVNLHRTTFGTVNYVMLGVCHYDKPIILTDFLTVNHGRYQELTDSSESLRIFKLGSFTYQFLSDSGSLFKIEPEPKSGL